MSERTIFNLWMVLLTAGWMTAFAVVLHGIAAAFGLIDSDIGEIIAFASGVFCGAYALVDFKRGENESE